MIKIDARGCGQGKSRSGIYPRLILNEQTNKPTLVIVPSKLIQDQYCNDLPDLPWTKIQSIEINDDGIKGNTKNVGADLISAMSQNKPLILITHQAFIQAMLKYSLKNNYWLECDEAINPFDTEKGINISRRENRDIKENISIESMSMFNDSKIGKLWFPVHFNKMISSSMIFSGDLWKKLNHPNWQSWMNGEQWTKFSGEDDIVDGHIEFTLSSSIFEGWRAVNIAASAFQHTKMALWMNYNEIPYIVEKEFVPHTKVPKLFGPEDYRHTISGPRRKKNEALNQFYEYVQEHIKDESIILLKNKNANCSLKNTEVVAPNCHGLNSYQHISNVCISSAINPDLEHSYFLRTLFYKTNPLISEDDFKKQLSLIFAGYDYYQVLMRSSLRDQNNKQLVNVFLMDSMIYNNIINFFDFKIKSGINEVTDPSIIELHCFKKKEKKVKIKKEKKIAMTNAEKQKVYRDRKKNSLKNQIGDMDL